MRIIRLIALLLLALIGIAWLTRPDGADFDAMLKAGLQKRIASTDIGESDDPLSTLALVGCKLRPSDCFAAIRAGLEVTEEDRILYTVFHVRAMGRETRCTGAFTSIWCNGKVPGG
ncbi:hypothetical protein [Albidovulum sp.]